MPRLDTSLDSHSMGVQTFETFAIFVGWVSRHSRSSDGCPDIPSDIPDIRPRHSSTDVQTFAIIRWMSKRSLDIRSRMGVQTFVRWVSRHSSSMDVQTFAMSPSSMDVQKFDGCPEIRPPEIRSSQTFVQTFASRHSHGRGRAAQAIHASEIACAHGRSRSPCSLVRQRFDKISASASTCGRVATGAHT